jgi:membrane protease YdiL (CAAX protease family)
MAAESKTFPEIFPPIGANSSPIAAEPDKRRWSSTWANWLQVGVVYGLILAVIWTPDGPLKFAWIVLAGGLILLFTIAPGYSARELGLGLPAIGGTLRILTAGILMALVLPAVAIVLREHVEPIRSLTLHSSWPYVVWAVLQQFVLQSFFYLRLESLIGGRWAVVGTAVLFATAHIPSPVLTATTLLGGLFFCEMFRRYRSILPLGLVHGLLGMTVAVSFSDTILHHMRVGIGYLSFHP